MSRPNLLRPSVYPAYYDSSDNELWGEAVKSRNAETVFRDVDTGRCLLICNMNCTDGDCRRCVMPYVYKKLD